MKSFSSIGCKSPLWFCASSQSPPFPALKTHELRVAGCRFQEPLHYWLLERREWYERLFEAYCYLLFVKWYDFLLATYGSLPVGKLRVRVFRKNTE